jgi:hypothetical protein
LAEAESKFSHSANQIGSLHGFWSLRPFDRTSSAFKR